MKDNDWRGQLQEIIEEETDMERPMIPRYAKGYAKLVLEDFISRELDKAREEGFEQGYKEAKFDCEMGKEFSKESFKEVVSSVLSNLKTKEDGK